MKAIYFKELKKKEFGKRYCDLKNGGLIINYTKNLD
jgi:hypothetical protein